MTDIYSVRKRSKIMSLIRSKDTGLEKLVFGYLRKEGIRFTKHYARVPGKPDIVVRNKRRAVFIDGDFWHGWRFSLWRGKLPKAFWRNKISENIKRDKRNFARLRRSGWKVLRIWGHELKDKETRQRTLGRIKEFLK